MRFPGCSKGSKPIKWGWRERKGKAGLLMSCSGPASMASGSWKNWNNVIVREAKRPRSLKIKKLKISVSLTFLAMTAEEEFFTNLLQDRKEKEKDEGLHRSCPP
jgi:hypothetical protein